MNSSERGPLLIQRVQVAQAGIEYVRGLSHNRVVAGRTSSCCTAGEADRAEVRMVGQVESLSAEMQRGICTKWELS